MPFKNPPNKLKSFKKDIAPIGFFFDFFSNENFKVPILPIPMRIDKITNGQPTLFIYPNISKLNRICQKYEFAINYSLFFSIGIKNLINFARKKFIDMFNRTLPNKFIIDWFNQSKLVDAKIPSLTKDFTYILSEFLKFYSQFDENNNINYVNSLIAYCDKMIKYFRKRLEKNYILTSKDGDLIVQQIYELKKGKAYPQIVPISVRNIKSGKMENMFFTPYLIYDDIIDIFSYNKQLLSKNKSANVALKTFSQNRIINKETRINNFNYKTIMEKIELKDLYEAKD